jgi:hypothetical protein
VADLTAHVSFQADNRFAAVLERTERLNTTPVTLNGVPFNTTLPGVPVQPTAPTSVYRSQSQLTLQSSVPSSSLRASLDLADAPLVFGGATLVSLLALAFPFRRS